MARQEPYDESCCACRGVCNHTGPHSYCNNHYPVFTGGASKITPQPKFCPHCGLDTTQAELGGTRESVDRVMTALKNLREVASKRSV